MVNITRIEFKNLVNFEEKIEIDLNNPVVMFGVNGTGKTSLMNILHKILSLTTDLDLFNTEESYYKIYFKLDEDEKIYFGYMYMRNVLNQKIM